MLGLTAGILLSMTLVSRYHAALLHLPTQVAKSTKFSKSTDEIITNTTDSTVSTILSVSVKQQMPIEKESSKAQSESFWVPGREGSFLKFKNTNSTSSSNGQDESFDLGPLGAGPRGNGKRKRLPKLPRGNERREYSRIDSGDENSVILDRAQSPIIKSPDISAYGGADSASVQSKFFNAAGQRVDHLKLILKNSDRADGILYDHPPWQPYHDQSKRQLTLDPPYIPSLSSIIMQRAAKLTQESSLQNKFQFASRFF